MNALISSTGGSPLLLLLASSSVKADQALEEDVLVTSLAHRMVAEATSRERQNALFLSAMVPFVDVGLLETAIDWDEAVSLLQWLALQPGFVAFERGVGPHERVRMALLELLDTTGPKRGRFIARAAQEYFIGRLTDQETRVSQSLHELAMVLRHEPSAAAFGFSHVDDTYPSPLLPSDIPVLLRAAEKFRGAEGAETLSSWLSSYPQRFVIARDRQTRPLGYIFTPLWDELTPEDRSESGFAALEGWLTNEAVNSMTGIFALRDWLIVDEQFGTSAAQGCLSGAHWRSTALSQGVVAVCGPDPSPFTPVWDSFADLKGPLFSSSGVRMRWWAHDRRQGSPQEWLRRVCQVVRAATDQQESDATAHSSSPQEESSSSNAFSPTLVKDALRHFHDERLLAETELAMKLGLASASVRQRVTTLRARLENEVQALGNAGLDGERALALRVTFIEQRRKQLEAAAVAGMSFGTYRRRLAEGIELLARRLQAV